MIIIIDDSIIKYIILQNLLSLPLQQQRQQRLQLQPLLLVDDDDDVVVVVDPHVQEFDVNVGAIDEQNNGEPFTMTPSAKRTRDGFERKRAFLAAVNNADLRLIEFCTYG